jgi:hypothetical protein
MTTIPSSSSSNGSNSNSNSPVSQYLSRLMRSNQPPPSATPNLPQLPGQASNNPFQRAGSSFGSRNSHQVYTLQPLQSTVVRFELKGLGDPFFRLSGTEPNSDYGTLSTLISALELGGEAVDNLKKVLDEQWQRYQLRGAFLMYKWSIQHWKALTAPAETPAKPTAETEEQDDDNAAPTPPVPKVTKFQCLRAIDLGLVLNVLARSRTQTLLTQTPLMFSQPQLERSIMSDDPRLVGLVKATGYLTEGEA